MSSSDTAAFARRFDGIERVVADPLRLKLRLGIGEDAFASLRVKKSLQEIWDVGGMAATGAAVAACPTVAATFFASTASGGIMTALGLGAVAATPVGWVVAAAIASGGAYIGVTRMMRNFSGSRVETIPKFLNTPVDLLGASLLDLIGALAARVAAIDGHVANEERRCIERHFVTDWGLDADYVSCAMQVIFETVDTIRVKDIARVVASFQADNPDCNPVAMQSELKAFLREVVAADGKIDEREELALDAIGRVFQEETELSLKKVGRHLSGWSKVATNAVSGLARKIPSINGKPSAA